MMCNNSWSKYIYNNTICEIRINQTKSTWVIIAWKQPQVNTKRGLKWTHCFCVISQLKMGVFTALVNTQRGPRWTQNGGQGELNKLLFSNISLHSYIYTLSWRIAILTILVDVFTLILATSLVKFAANGLKMLLMLCQKLNLLL